MIVRKGAARRRAAAAVEAAILLPTLVLLALITFDFCRVFHYYTVVTNCARNGAIYAADNIVLDSDGNLIQLLGAGSPYTVSADLATNVQNAALADWPSDLGSQPTVSLRTTTADGHTYADVTVSYTFRTVAAYAAVPATVSLSRKVRVRITQALPNS
jgi:Flp pilus assembly protein TadG